VVPTQPIAPPPAPAVVAPSPETPCSTLPKTTVYFGFNLSIVKPEYLPAIRSVEDWMEKNPSCHVVIEGYTSKEASYHYNDGLGGDRSLRVYKIMQRDDPKITDRLTRHVSAGKYFATKDFPNHKDTWQDRKVVFSIRDITSE
jgi:outer membrane protein OmpA-like peptidoglycan-associated protein